MPESRTLDIPAGHREFYVKIEGSPVGREQQLLSVSVIKTVNRISSARLVYLDGTASASDFPLSNEDSFIPGKEIEILAGAESEPVSLFKGIIIRQGIKVRANTAPQLIVECRHKAVKLTVGRKNGYFFDQTDSDIITSLLDKASVEGDVESTSLSHKQQVQYYSTDWDFILSRAEASGKLILTNDDKVAVKAPSLSGSPVCTLLFGSTILEMDAQIDARLQYPVKSFTWDPAGQSVLEKEAADPGTVSSGNIESDTLAGVIGLEHYHLQHAALNEEEAQAWADAQMLKSRMSKVNGSVKCEGLGTVNPGDVIKLSGAGERFNGNLYVTGVRHDMDLVMGWKTNIQFGSTEKWFAEENSVSAAKASALLPGINGLQIGVVVSNEDPDNEHRVRVKMPLVNNDEDGTWARVAAVDAGEERGFFFRPEIGDEVVLGFLNDDPRQAVLLGMLHSSAKAAPLAGSDDNHEKMYQSRSKMKVHFDDDKIIMKLETPAGNKITLTEEDKAIKIEDQNDNKIIMNEDGISIESPKMISIKAGTEIKMESGKDFSIKSDAEFKAESAKAFSVKSGTELKIESGTSFTGKGGTEVKLESGTSFGVKGGTELKLEGTAGTEVSSSAITKVKGSLVQIN